MHVCQLPALFFDSVYSTLRDHLVDLPFKSSADDDHETWIEDDGVSALLPRVFLAYIICRRYPLIYRFQPFSILYSHYKKLHRQT